MARNTVLFCFALFALISPQALAVDVSFKGVEKNYSPGRASISLTITNTLSENSDIVVSSYIAPKDYPGYPDAPPGTWDLNLSPGQIKTLDLSFTVSDTAEAGTHLIVVGIEGDESASFVEEFEVIGTLIPMDIYLLACSGQCDSYTSVFLLNESPIKLSVGGPEGTRYEATARLPSGAVRTLDFSGGDAILPIDEPGDYTIRAIASKPGYKGDEDIIDIKVIETLPEVITDMPCNADGLCNGEETRQNCPMDCLSGEVGPLAKQITDSQSGAVSQPQNSEKGKTLPDQADGGGAGIIPILILGVIILIVAVLINNNRGK